SRIGIGAQNLFWEVNQGAYTGEVSGSMIRAAGGSHVIVGHSERRQYFCETNQIVSKKTIAALESGLTPIVCVGENLAQRESGQTETVILDHCHGSLSALTAAQFAKAH